MNRRGTEPYARWCERTEAVRPPPTRLRLPFGKTLQPLTGLTLNGIENIGAAMLTVRA